MFDQNWLKRYMLSNHPTGDDPNSAPVSKVVEKPLPKAEPRRVPDLGLANANVGVGDESARLRERTGLSQRDNPPVGGLSGRPPQPGMSQRGGLSAVMPGLPTITEPHKSSSSTAQPPVAAQPCAPVPSSALPMDRAPSGLGSQVQPRVPFEGPPPRHYDEKPAPGVRGGGAPEAPAPPPMPWGTQMNAGLYGQPGLFGGAPLDQGMNMAGPGNLFNYSNEGGGLKHYVVMCKDDVEVRASPTYADDSRIGHFLHPGQVIVIDDRRMVTGSWFLHLADGRGWVFETKERLLVMTEAHDFQRGLWHYSVCCDDEVETRISPTYSDDARTGLILGPGDCIAVDERCNVAGARFLKLADGRGWVFETKDRLLVMSEVRAKAQEARDFARGLWHYTVVCDDDVEIRAAPTYSDEARTGLMVHPGDCVAIDERCRVAAVWFLRLADGRGWVFESKDSRRVMMQLH